MLTAGVWRAPFGLDDLSGFVVPEQTRASIGDVILVRLTCAAGEAAPAPADVVASIRDVRRGHPGCPVALWVPDAPLQVAIDTVRAAASAQVRAILGGETLDPRLLREQLTHPLGLSAFVLRWASDAGYMAPGMEQDDVRELLDAAPDVRTLGRLALQRQMAARTWRSRLQQMGLPTPYAWLGLGHALHVAFFVQRNSSEALQTLSERLGMLSVAHMSQKFRRVFGLSPGQVRDLLGAEPLLHRWFQGRTRS
jgi:AraC-like DNA-binding protein